MRASVPTNRRDFWYFENVSARPSIRWACHIDWEPMLLLEKETQIHATFGCSGPGIRTRPERRMSFRGGYSAAPEARRIQLLSGASLRIAYQEAAFGADEGMNAMIAPGFR